MFQFASLPDKIIAYHLRDGLNLSNSFKFFLNGEIKGESDKPDFTFEGLEPGKEYDIEIRNSDGEIQKSVVSTKTVNHIVRITPNDDLAKAISSLAENDLLILSKGRYETGAVDLKSHISIKLEEGTEIVGSSKKEDYLPFINSRFEGREMKCYRSLINAGNLDSKAGPNVFDICIYGKGKIIGGGNPLADDIIEAHKAEYEGTDYQKFLQAGRLRGRLINISNGKGIIIEGLTLGYSPSWNIHMIYSEDIITANCRIESIGIHNGDGWDPDSSSRCYLFHSVFNTGDDCVAIKSGKNPEGNKIAKPSYDIEVFDCFAINGHGLAVGSELSGGVEKVRFYLCDFSKSEFGIHIKTTRKRGGFAKDIAVEDTSVSSIHLRTVTYNDDGESSGELTSFKGMLFKNLTLDGLRHYPDGHVEDVYPIEVMGFEDDESKFDDIHFENITINNAKKEPIVEHATNVTVERN